MVHFAAQAIDVDIHHVRCRINPHAPDVIQDHGASYYASGIAAKIFQERKLLRSQLEQLIAAASLMTDEIKLQIGGLQPYRVILWRRRPAQKISQPRKQFSQGKRFRQIVISSLLQSLTRSSTERRADRINTGAELPWARHLAIKSRPSISGSPRSMMKASWMPSRALSSPFSRRERYPPGIRLPQCAFEEPLNGHVVFYKQ